MPTSGLSAIGESSVVHDGVASHTMSAIISTPSTRSPELHDSVGLPSDLVRLALDQLSQAVFLYRPEFDGDRIIDLEIIYSNRTALELPLNKHIVPGAWASDVFLDHQVALDAAQEAWEGEVPSKYVVVRQGVVDGGFATVRFEITTGRAGDLLLQTAHDLTIDDQLAQSEARLQKIVHSLDEAIVLFEPLFDDELDIIDVRTIFRNERAEVLDAQISAPGAGATIAPTLAEFRDVWRTNEPLLRWIDNLDGADPHLPSLALEIRLTRIDQCVVQMVRDHTDQQRATRAEDDANRRLATTLDALGEGVGIFDPVHDANGDVVDFVLSVANAAMTEAIAVGQSSSEIPIEGVDPLAIGIRALQQPGVPITTTLTLADFDPATTWRTSIVATDGQVVLVAADITEMQDAFARVTASDDMLRTVLESLAESVRVFAADGQLTYANRASIELLGAPTGADDRDGAYIVCDADGTPLETHERPRERGFCGEVIDDMVVAIQRPDLDDVRVCRVAVRPIPGATPTSPSAVVVSAHDITEPTKYAAQLEWMSTHTPETGLLNRHGLIQAMSHDLTGDGGEFVTLWIRLRALDTIRPTFGFDAGDEVVRIAAERVAEIARSFHGLAAHPTNNELVVVAPGDHSLARRLGEVLTDRLSVPVEVAGATLPVDPSIGFAISPRHGRTPDDLLNRAKTAAWTAEREGSGQVGWRTDLGVEQIRRIELLGDIPRAIEAGELFLRYQPKFDVQTGHLVGAEALARWTRGSDGIVTPDEFIPAIEASGMAFPFTVWVIEHALTEWASVLPTLPNATIAVNVPGPLIGDRKFAATVEKIMQRLGIPSGVLLLEITERTVADSINSIAHGIDRFAELGVGVSIDDFGTGQSSLEYLRRLRPTEIKIDRAFVAGAGADPIDRSVLKACIDIGKAADLSVCGEGVETEAELDLLKTLGCNTVQGFLLARPGTMAELLSYT